MCFEYFTNWLQNLTARRGEQENTVFVLGAYFGRVEHVPPDKQENLGQELPEFQPPGGYLEKNK